MWGYIWGTCGFLDPDAELINVMILGVYSRRNVIIRLRQIRFITQQLGKFIGNVLWVWLELNMSGS